MKLILFGANKLTEVFLNSGKYEVEYVVDNNLEKLSKIYVLPKGKTVPVREPESIKSEEKGSFLILIMTKNSKYIKEIENQLESFHLQKEKDYISIAESKLDLDFLDWDMHYCTSVIEKNGDFWPKVLHLGLSDVCNLKCLFCGFHGRKTPWVDSGHFMTMEIAECIAEQAKKIKTLDTLYITHDGEDLLNKEWFEIVQLILNKTQIRKFRIYTNGMLLNDDNIDKLQQINADEVSLVISIDGKSAEENDEIRRGSNYRIIRNNVYNARQKLDEKKYEMIINNNHIIDENLIKKQNYIFNKFEQDVPEFLKKDFERKGMTVLATPTLYLAPERMGFPEFPDYKFVKARKSHRISGCFNPFEVISINAQGGILYCGCNVTQDEIGTVQESDMLKVWQSNIKLQEARKMIKNIRCTPELCNNCPSKIDGDFYLVCR